MYEKWGVKLDFALGNAPRGWGGSWGKGSARVTGMRGGMEESGITELGLGKKYRKRYMSDSIPIFHRCPRSYN